MTKNYANEHPKNKKKNQDKNIKVAGGGGSQDYLQVRYLEGDGNNFSFRETLTGGLAPTPTSADAVLDVNYEAICGLEVLGKEHCAIVTGF